MIRTYSELIRLPTFEERFQYLRINSRVGEETFGYDRWLNQVFYRTGEWKAMRRRIIARDLGCDLACSDREIYDEPIVIHHMNPISLKDIANRTEFLLNPEYLITTIDSTHKAIHYGDVSLLQGRELTERTPGDTCLWRNKHER